MIKLNKKKNYINKYFNNKIKINNYVKLLK